MTQDFTAKIFDYSRLSGRIVEVCGSQRVFSEKMGLSQPTISKKTNGKAEWTQSEITDACDILGIKKNEIPSYFFSIKS